MKLHLLRPTSRPAARGEPAKGLRICHVLSSLEVGGAERIVLRLAQVQAAEHCVSILALRGGMLEAEAKRLGLSVHVCRRPSWRVGLMSAVHFATHRFDVVNSHNRHAQKYAALARRTPVVMTLHAECRQDYGWAVRRPWADGIIAVSQRAAETFRKLHSGWWFRYPIEVVENGIATERPSASREQVRSRLELSHQVVLIAVARLDPFKDFPTLLHAFARCRPRERGLVLLLVGDGSCRAELESMTRQLGLEGLVRFLGLRTDVADLLSASDLFVLSSHTEGMPVSVLEAMAMALPVVSTAVGGVPEVVEDGVTGMLVPPRDPEALAAALSSLIEARDRWSEMGTAGRERVLSRFSLQGMMARYDAFYRRVLARGSSPGE